MAVGHPESDLREHEEAARSKRVLLVDSTGNIIASLPIGGNVGVKDASDVRINPAKEDGNLALIKAKTDNLDLAITALRDALRGTSNKTLTDLQTRLDALLADATFTGRLGEVQASPTANTVLARLKDLLTGIVLAAGNNIIGKVAGSIPSGATRVKKTVTATTAQTGTAIITPTSGKTLTITYVQIQIGGTTAGNVQVWFGASADTTYTRGTDPAIFDGEFAPSATLKPGVTPPAPREGWSSETANDVLRYTTSAAMTIYITVWGYEI